MQHMYYLGQDQTFKDSYSLIGDMFLLDQYCIKRFIESILEVIFNSVMFSKSSTS